MQLKYSQRGASLIEVMIAMLIFAIGILGMSALQTRASQESFDTQQRAAAVNIANELTDRMNLNKNVLQSYVDAAANDGLCEAVVDPICAQWNNGGGLQAAAICTPEEMALFDVWQASCLDMFGEPASVSGLSPRLINADIDIECLGGCGLFTDVRVSLSWTSKSAASDSRLADNEAAQRETLVLEFRP